MADLPHRVVPDPASTLNFERIDEINASAESERARLLYRINSQGLTGGGTTTVTSGWAISWSARFIPIAIGRGTADSATDGYFNIAMPANGTVITGMGGASNITVSGGTIAMPIWSVLWYKIPFGGGVTSLDANWVVSAYTSDFDPGLEYIPIARRHSDPGAHIKWADGRVQSANTTLLPTAIPGAITWYAYRTAAQNCYGSNSINNLLINAVVFDTAGIVNTSTNRVIPTTAGYYRAGGSMQIQDYLTSSYVGLHLRKNGGAYVTLDYENAGSTSWPTPTGSAVVYCNGTTDYLQLAMTYSHSLPSPGALETNPQYTYFMGEYIGP